MQVLEASDPRNAHDQQTVDVSSANAVGVDDPNSTASISVSALLDISEESQQNALDIASVKLVHRRSDKLGRCGPSCLSDMVDSHPDLFGAPYEDETHPIAVGFRERLRRILNDASGRLQSPEFVLPAFSKLRTHNTDLEAFIHTRLMSDEHAKQISRVKTEEFIVCLNRENEKLRRIRSGEYKAKSEEDQARK